MAKTGVKITADSSSYQQAMKKAHPVTLQTKRNKQLTLNKDLL